MVVHCHLCHKFPAKAWLTCADSFGARTPICLVCKSEIDADNLRTSLAFVFLVTLAGWWQLGAAFVPFALIHTVVGGIARNTNRVLLLLHWALWAYNLWTKGTDPIWIGASGVLTILSAVS